MKFINCEQSGMNIQQYNGHLSWNDKNYFSKCSWWAVSSLYTDTLSKGKWKGGGGGGGEGKEETVKECIIPTQFSITLSQYSAVIAIFHCDDLF